MITRFKYKKPETRDSSKDDEFVTYSYEKRIKVLSTNKDGSVDKYVEECFWKEEKNSWSEYMKSFDLGSPQEQVMNHLTKGTPLLTAHTLPPADYTKLGKGAEIRKEMTEKGISLDMIVQAVKEQIDAQQKGEKQEEGNPSGGEE